MDSESDDEYVDFWIGMFIQDYNKDNPNHKMTKCEVNSIERICEAVLPLG